MYDYDFIFIAQSNITNYNEFSQFSIERIELFSNLVFPRMVYFNGQFCSHLDIINKLLFEASANGDDDYNNIKKLNVWDIPSFNGLHISSYLSGFGFKTKVINNIDTEWSIFCDSYRNNVFLVLLMLERRFDLNIFLLYQNI